MTDDERARDALSTAYGFRVPLAYARLVLAARSIDLQEAVNVVRLCVDESDLREPAFRNTAIDVYDTWVPEFFEIMQAGVDGIGYGLVVHAPELARDDWPMFEHSPDDYQAARPVFFGETLGEGLEMLVAHDPRYEPRTDDLRDNPAYTALASAMGLSLERKTLVRRTLGTECYIPPTPEGWRFVPCSDMIGTLAPQAAFAAENPHGKAFLERAGDDRRAAAEAILAHTRAMLGAGLPGSALATIRCVYRWRALLDDAKVHEMLQLWADVYDALDRPLLAGVVRDRIARMDAVAHERLENPTVVYGERVVTFVGWKTGPDAPPDTLPT
jgi:hypothetical protein